jgi:hypothetical protein
VDAEHVVAMAYDVPIPGYGTETVNNLRLWSAKAAKEFDLRLFNEGNYEQSVESRNSSENISKVLYPNDASASGRELRLKQQYFFVSASIQDILHRFLACLAVTHISLFAHLALQIHRVRYRLTQIAPLLITLLQITLARSPLMCQQLMSQMCLKLLHLISLSLP